MGPETGLVSGHLVLVLCGLRRDGKPRYSVNVSKRGARRPLSRGRPAEDENRIEMRHASGFLPALACRIASLHVTREAGRETICRILSMHSRIVSRNRFHGLHTRKHRRRRSHQPRYAPILTVHRVQLALSVIGTSTSCQSHNMPDASLLVPQSLASASACLVCIWRRSANSSGPLTFSFLITSSRPPP